MKIFMPFLVIFGSPVWAFMWLAGILWHLTQEFFALGVKAAHDEWLRTGGQK